MRTVVCDGVGTVSCLGFGCASLGSRISERSGRAAIDQALAAGITWFDVAPSYGGGRAERILGDALRGSKAFIATKVGIAAAREGSAKRMAGFVARPLLAAVPALRGLVRSARGAAAHAIPLDGETIRTSIARSLEALRRDHVAMLALHGPSPDDVRNEDVIRALADVRDQGLALQIGIAGSVEAFNAARAAGLDAAIAQIANDPFEPALRRLEGAPFTITHSVFGVAGALERLRERMGDAAFRVRIADLGHADPASLLLDYAFAANPDGIVVTSNFTGRHLGANVAPASVPPDRELAARLEVLLA